MLHHINEVVTVAEAAESVEMTETAVDDAQHEQIPRRRKKWFESDFLGDQGKNAKVFGIKGT